MIPVIFMDERLESVRGQGAEAQVAAAKDGAREGAAVLGFTVAIGAYGGFFIPKSYGTSIDMTGSPHAALWWFIVFSHLHRGDLVVLCSPRRAATLLNTTTVQPSTTGCPWRSNGMNDATRPALMDSTMRRTEASVSSLVGATPPRPANAATNTITHAFSN